MVPKLIPTAVIAIAAVIIVTWKILARVLSVICVLTY
jgi:hypothetical protein